MTPRRKLLIPEEMIIEIISKLPVKSLVRFKCVSQSWCFLLSSPHFIKKHVRVTEAEASLESRRIILHQPRYNIKSYSLHSICPGWRFFSSLDHDYPRTCSYGQLKKIGSCNGLVCLCIGNPWSEDLVLWNPCIRESIRLMDPDSKKNYIRSSLLTHYAFGYCQESDDYKVVKLIGACKQVKIYSLRKDSWEKIEGFPFEVARVQSSVFVGGALSWGVRRGSENSWSIVSLGFRNKRFLEIRQPDYKEGSGSASNPLLKVLDGCLCVVSETSNVSVDIWMMKEYGVKESWVRLITVPFPSAFTSASGNPRTKTLCFLNNKVVLMYFGKKPILYNFENNTFDEDLRICGIEGCLDEADTYVESIVSPKAYKGIDLEKNAKKN